MSAEDNHERLPFARSLSGQAWVEGEMNFDGNNRSNWDLEQDIKKGLLWRYCSSVDVFKCPADKSTVKPTSGPFKG